MDSFDTILRASDLVAVLGRDVRVRLVDISACGCRLASDRRLAEGTTGTLRVTYDGTDYADDVRIVRCDRADWVHGGFWLGAEFLWTSNPRAESLRRVLATLQAGAIRGTAFGVSEQN